MPCQITRLKRFLSSAFCKTQRSYEKIMCICYFIGSVVKIILYLHFLHTKDKRLWQIKKKHEWSNNHFSDLLLLFSFWWKIISCLKKRVYTFLSISAIKWRYSLGNYTSNNTRQHDTTQVQHGITWDNTRQHECKTRQHKYNTRQHE